MIRVEGRVGGDLTGQITDWAALSWAEEVNTVTGGSITLPADSAGMDHVRLAPTSTAPVGFVFTDTNTGHQVPVYIVEEVDSSAGDVTIPFQLDAALLNDVPAFPAPADPTDPWAADSHWVRTGDAVGETAQFVLVHGGQFSHPDYQFFDRVTATADIGVDVTYRARMQPCLDVIRETVAGLSIVQGLIENHEMRLFVRARETRPEAVFSPDLHTIDEWEWRNRMPAGNTFYAGGGGEGTARELAVAELATTLWPRRRGRFIDRRQSSGADLQRAADEAAVWDGPTLRVVGVDSPALTYGLDYLLGDVVTVEVRGAEYALPVTAVDTTVDEDGIPVRSVQLGASLPDGRPDVELARSILRTFGLKETP